MVAVADQLLGATLVEIVRLLAWVAIASAREVPRRSEDCDLSEDRGTAREVVGHL